jgi:hypothetical protein
LEEVDGPVMGLLEYMSSTLSSVMNPIWILEVPRS